MKKVPLDNPYHALRISDVVVKMSENLSKLNVGGCGRGIQLSEGRKGKKKEELFDLCKKAAAMKEIKLASYVSSAKDRKKLLEDKLKTSEQIFRT